MDLRDFLRTFVDGYLISDLRAMLAVRPTGDSRFGALGYPIVASTCAGIELLGTLSCEPKAAVDFNEGRRYFRWFWQNWMCTDEGRRDLADPVYELLRNGIAHSFVGRPRVEVGRFGGSRDMHLTRKPRSEVLHVDADALANDFVNAYVALSSRVQANLPFREYVGNRLAEYPRLSSKKSDSHKDRIRRVSERHAALGKPQAGSLGVDAVASPSIGARFVQLSSKGF